MPDQDLPPGANPVTSRWAKSALTFGPAGRIGWTVALLLPEWWLLHQDLYAFPAFGLWTLVVLPLTLRQVWKPTRVRRERSPEGPPGPPRC